ncbi:MAG: hypothetical protein QXM12_03185, partial [Nitrososphaerota archaeon]
TKNEYNIDIPIGVVLVVSVDYNTRSVSLVSASPPPAVATAVPQTVTPIITPLPTNILSKAPVLTATTLIVYGVFASIFLGLYTLTKSLGVSLVVSGFTAVIYLIASGDMTSLPYVFVSLAVGLSLYASGRE